MSIQNLITLAGGLAMFLYGMRLMGDGLKENSSGTLKTALERLTNTPLKAFLLGLVMTAVIQSSTATIVISAGLVGAGVISLHQSLGIVVGANVGTTVTGQIIRLLDLDAGGNSPLRLFHPSTLAPLALIIGIVMIKAHIDPNRAPGAPSQIAIGFGLLFSGLMGMTNAVSSLSDSGIIEQLFGRLGQNPFLAYGIGAAVAFVLQSSSASIGILQAFSMSGQLTFGAIYAVLVGIYLGDCVTTALVINIGSAPPAKRVGTVNILYNLSKSLMILAAVTVLHAVGALETMWNAPIYSGGIANTNTVFNLVCALLLLPVLGGFERLSYKLVREQAAPQTTHSAVEDAFSPTFFATPALAFGRCYEALLAMFGLARTNIERAFAMFDRYDADKAARIAEDENAVDEMADKIGNYLVQLSAHISAPYHVEILSQYFSVVTEFERLSDRAVSMAKAAAALHQQGAAFSPAALEELHVLRDLLYTILDYTHQTFEKRDVEAARHIEPLEQVVDDLVNALKENHTERLRRKECTLLVGTAFLDLLLDLERISDCCSNVGMATIARAMPEVKHQVHGYAMMLHAGRDETYNREYRAAHERYFGQLPAAHR